jgi:hypothetical protein
VIAFLHYHPESQELLGVWVLTEDGPEPFYPEANAGYKLYATDVLEAKLDDASWATYLQQLVESQPRSAWWELMDLPGTPTPQEAWAAAQRPRT